MSRRPALRLLRDGTAITTSRGRGRGTDSYDRFIPNRSSMDFDYAHFMLTEGRDLDKNPNPKEESAYRMGLRHIFNMNPERRILAFRNRPNTPASSSSSWMFQSEEAAPRPRPPTRRIPDTADRVLGAPDILHDFSLNLLDWGASNVIALALSNTVYLWRASDSATSELVTVSDDDGPITSLSWAPDGRHLALGFSNSTVEIWDSASAARTTTLQGCHTSPVSALAWNNHHTLTTGGSGMDSLILNNDTRISDHVVQRYHGHTQGICGLKWSPSGRQLVSGGNDNLVYLWDRSAASSTSPTQWLHRFRQHTAAVKALAWSPFQSNLLASGGGEGDGTINFWNTQTGARLNSINTGSSQVCGLLWNTKDRELLSSHGNHLALWKYPSLLKLAELTGHTSTVLHMAQSPDGCTVATAAGDETLRFWNVFGTPGLAKPVSNTKPDPFTHVNRIR